MTKLILYPQIRNFKTQLTLSRGQAVVHGLLMEHVLLLILPKSEGGTRPPCPPVPPALYVPLDSLQCWIFISSILNWSGWKKIPCKLCGEYFFFFLPTVTNYGGYIFHCDNMDSLLLSIQHYYTLKPVPPRRRRRKIMLVRNL